MSHILKGEEKESFTNVDNSSTLGQNSVGTDSTFDETLGLTKGIKEYVIDIDKEDGERIYEDLKAKAEELSRRNDLSSHDGNSLVSVEGLSFKEATIKETNLVRAYFLSDAFKERVVKSLGYDRLESMSSEDRKVYEDIVGRGKELVTGLRVGLLTPEQAKNTGSICFADGKNTIVLVDPNDKDLGLSTLTHELAHHLYTDRHVDPGVREEEKRYGKSDSPYNTINKSKISDRGIRNVYKDFDSYVSELGEEIGLKDARKIALGFIKLHDNKGRERAADVQGVRMLMMQEGLWNPFTGEPVTVEQIKAFRKSHPDSRIFEYWSDKEAAYYLNTIAMSDKVKPDNIRLGYGVEGECHLFVSVGESAVDKVITQMDYNKLMALDASKRVVFLSRLFESEGYHFDFSEGVSLADLLKSDKISLPEGRDVADSNTNYEKPDYRSLSISNFEAQSHDFEEEIRQGRGMSV